MGLFRRRITVDTDLERLSDRRLLAERERLVASHDPHGGAALGASFGLASDIEDVLERRGVAYPTPQEILDRRRGVRRDAG